ncbi:hypothetical protein L6164_018124 [Bauhinia variegata]|uniref:Uncharacterized protein n=1 Tax=Bauhinia variegata TaxID=167791 RepID=A0ACB9NBX2_BAUVA|nr:hypothetical protein L6164_018124 [Bauhinia variegata]
MNALLVFVILLFCRAETKAPLPSTGFSIDLIHRDLSPLSPFYNSSMTPSERVRKAAQRSISRFDENKAQTDIMHNLNKGDYLMKFFIGSPPVETLAVADTGSDLIWVPCLPCGNCNQQTAFDPAKSSTFKVENCDSQACNSLQIHSCGNSNQCRYRYSYGDKTYTIGDLATESINFGSTNGQAASFPESVFGCGYDNHQFGRSESPTTGLVGLGRGALSLVSQLSDQLGHKFSYCLSPSSSSKLKFGSEATISGNGVVSTPIFSEKDPSFYYLNLEGISVGQKTIQTGKTDGNIVIDSGTTLTILETSFYNNLRAAVVEAIGVQEVQNPPQEFDLCYTSGSVQQFPSFVFHFTSADIKLQTENMFTGVGNLLCFSAVPSDGLSLFGNIAQINFHVKYDNEENKVSFAPADCTKQ